MKPEAITSAVRDVLYEVIDPETGLSIMRMDLIHGLSANEQGDVSLVFRPSSPVCPMAYSLADSIKKKIKEIEKVKSVCIRVENFHKAEHLEALLNSD
jgi:metal-sulfur cluster biosynthetic enzyme